MSIWVDTDMGFDDLWALLLLKRLGHDVHAVSLVAGNAPLEQVIRNGQGANASLGLDMELHAGADRPILRSRETAERILGPQGMCSRGRRLPQQTDADMPPSDGVAALARWLLSAPVDAPRNVLALGPLTNLAHLVCQYPQAIKRITRLVWMGGSDGAGNHSAAAEFNALADPEAVALVASSGARLDVIDLQICRSVVFGPDDLPQTEPLLADLLGGYLDIALTRGRAAMAIYDPVAALALARPDGFEFRPVAMKVSTTDDATYGATRFTPVIDSAVRLATRAPSDAARQCLNALSDQELAV